MIRHPSVTEQMGVDFLAVVKYLTSVRFKELCQAKRQMVCTGELRVLLVKAEPGSGGSD